MLTYIKFIGMEKGKHFEHKAGIGYATIEVFPRNKFRITLVCKYIPETFFSVFFFLMKPLS